MLACFFGAPGRAHILIKNALNLLKEGYPGRLVCDIKKNHTSIYMNVRIIRQYWSCCLVNDRLICSLFIRFM